MGKRDLPDIYIPEPEGCRPKGEGIYIRQIPIAYVIPATKVHTISNKSIKILKPTITTVLHLLGYKYICVMIYKYISLPWQWDMSMGYI